MNEPLHIYGRVTSHIWKSHVTSMKESRHIYERVTSHIWKSHVTYIESRHIHSQLSAATSKKASCSSWWKHLFYTVTVTYLWHGFFTTIWSWNCRVAWWKSHVTLCNRHVIFVQTSQFVVKKPCHIYVKVTWYSWKRHSWWWRSHVTYTKESRDVHENVTSHTRKRHIHIRKSIRKIYARDIYARDIYARVTRHSWRHITYIHESTLSRHLRGTVL